MGHPVQFKTRMVHIRRHMKKLNNSPSNNRVEWRNFRSTHLDIVEVDLPVSQNSQKRKHISWWLATSSHHTQYVKQVIFNVLKGLYIPENVPPQRMIPHFIYSNIKPELQKAEILSVHMSLEAAFGRGGSLFFSECLSKIQ